MVQICLYSEIMSELKYLLSKRKEMKPDYNSDHYVDPRKTYDRIADKVKLGHLLYNREKGSYVVVDLEVLQELVEFEKSENNIRKYFPIPINDLWLTSIFNFEKKQLATHSGTFFTSIDHGLKSIIKEGDICLVTL